MKRMTQFIIFLSALLSGATYANCPLPHHVTYEAHEMNGHTYSTWSPKNGWYEGSGAASVGVKIGEHAASFVKATWFPYLDDLHGATNCFYLDSHGGLITLFQQTGYGDVPPPTERNWHQDTYDSSKALSCMGNSLFCNFEFAERT